VIHGIGIFEIPRTSRRSSPSRGAGHPAEDGVGDLYRAKPARAGFRRTLDPTNSLNPGLGRTTKCAHWDEPEKTDAR
jgi:hypothetical protein